jgi:hypothetical protein
LWPGNPECNNVTAPVVRYCTYCKEVCVRGAHRPLDAILVYIYGDDRRAFWNGRDLIIQDGICERCRAEKFPETVKP